MHQNALGQSGNDLFQDPPCKHDKKSEFYYAFFALYLSGTVNTLNTGSLYKICGFNRNLPLGLGFWEGFRLEMDREPPSGVRTQLLRSCVFYVASLTAEFTLVRFFRSISYIIMQMKSSQC